MKARLGLLSLALSALLLTGCSLGGAEKPLQVSADAVPTAYEQIEPGSMQLVEVSGRVEDVAFFATDLEYYGLGDVIPSSAEIDHIFIMLETTRKDEFGASVVICVVANEDYSPLGDDDVLGIMSLTVGQEVTLRGSLYHAADGEPVENYFIDFCEFA